MNGVFKNDKQVEKFRRGVSKHIDQTKLILEAALELTLGNSENHLIKEDREAKFVSLEGYDETQPLFGLRAFNRHRIQNPLHFLQGAYAASRMDSAYMRNKTMELYPIDFNGNPLIIGTGTCHIGNYDKLKEFNISITELAENKHSKKQINDLHKKGIIDKNGKKYRKANEEYKENQINVFIRETLGEGCCDDATLIAIGLMHKKQNGLESALDAFYGGAMIDTVDTIDKVGAMPIFGGTDEHLGHYINNRYRDATGKDLVSDEEICKAILMGSKGNWPNFTHSSSVRRFHQLEHFENGKYITALQAHMNYIRTGEITKGVKLGFSQVQSDIFYQAFNTRLEIAQKKDLIKC
jgi:hypothetical protein